MLLWPIRAGRVRSSKRSPMERDDQVANRFTSSSSANPRDGRSTTPYMDKLKNEAIFLQDAVADANLTFWSVPIILTGITPEQFTTAPIRGNIVDLAKEAGYSTTW